MWEMAGLAAAALAVAPHQLGGVLIRAGAGPVRDAWTDAFRRLWASAAPLRRMPAAIDDDRLLGGLDLAATLAGGHPVAQRGLLAECHDGMLLVPMAERLTAGTAAHLGVALDRGISVAERDGMTLTSPAAFCVLALDESEADDPQVPLALQDRLAFRLDLHTLSHRDILPWSVRRDDVVAARLRLADIALDEEALTTLAGLAEAFGVSSLRALSQVALTARVMAALNGEARVGDTEISLPPLSSWHRGRHDCRQVRLPRTTRRHRSRHRKRTKPRINLPRPASRCRSTMWCWRRPWQRSRPACWPI